MLKSEEIKAEMTKLQDEIKAMAEKGESVPAEMSEKLKSLLVEQGKAEAMEEMAKNKVVKAEIGGKMDRKQINAALRKFLLNDDVEAKKILATAAGQNGATAADGGVLVPEELLNLKGNNKVVTDLREIATPISVHTRSGSVPIIDYSQAVKLTDFDENNEITQTKAAFTSAKFSLASKGAIIPVSRELLADADADVLSIIGTLFNRVYIRQLNTEILAAVTGATPTTATVAAIASKAGIDAIKSAVNSIPLDAGANASIVMNQYTFAELANAADKNDRYYLAQDANGETIKRIEGRPIVVVENACLANGAVVIGDFSAIYHIAYPELEVASSEEAGFTKNSVLVRAIARFQDLNTYASAFQMVKKSST